MKGIEFKVKMKTTPNYMKKINKEEKRVQNCLEIKVKTKIVQEVKIKVTLTKLCRT